MVTRALGDPEDVRDVTQETLARAVEALQQGRVPSGLALNAFVYGIARHVIADALRRRAREDRHLPETPSLASSSPSPLEQLVRADEAQGVRRALDRLPKSDRWILERCYLDGERLVDVANRLGQPAARIRKRKWRALKRLREALGRDGRGSRHVSPRNSTSST